MLKKEMEFIFECDVFFWKFPVRLVVILPFSISAAACQSGTFNFFRRRQSTMGHMENSSTGIMAA